VTVISVQHRGLRALLEDDDHRYLNPSQVDRIRKVLTALIASRSIDDFVWGAPPGWRVHRLRGARQGEWSVSISRNWRITFVEKDGLLSHLDLEDYH